mmetsp:Transcript_88673/g.246247  ORF Transcript_88673/g.246247 Transcript_88673/m.246247 type:complete len:223 (+) Transcript_88673:1184-1852(+)
MRSSSGRRGSGPGAGASWRSGPRRGMVWRRSSPLAWMPSPVTSMDASEPCKRSLLPRRAAGTWKMPWPGFSRVGSAAWRHGGEHSSGNQTLWQRTSWSAAARRQSPRSLVAVRQRRGHAAGSRQRLPVAPAASSGARQHLAAAAQKPGGRRTRRGSLKRCARAWTCSLRAWQLRPASARRLSSAWRRSAYRGLQARRGHRRPVRRPAVSQRGTVEAWRSRGS